MADHARHIGDWDAAEAAYEHVRAWSAAAPHEEAQATLGLAQTYMTRGAYSPAIELLTGFLDRAPSPEDRADAEILLGDAWRASGDYEAAADYYAAAETVYPVLSLHLETWRGDLLYAAGVYTAAHEAYGTALEEADTPSWQVSLLEKLAVTRAALSDGEGSLAAYDEILAIARIPDYRARIMYQAADTALLFGDTQAAYERMDEIITTYPTAPQAHQALIKLVEGGWPVDERLRGLIDYYAEAYDPAVQAFYRIILNDPEHTGEPHYYAALAYLGAENYDSALYEFDFLIETHPDDPLVPDAWMGKAAVLVAQGYPDAAVQIYERVARRFADHARAPEALREAAGLLEAASDFERAAAVLDDLAESYPDDENAPEARFHAGLLRYREGNLVQAQETWSDLTVWYPYDDRTQAAWFWLGKTHLTAGETLSATEALSQAVSLGNANFYGLRANDLLQGKVPFEDQHVMPIACDDPALQQEAETWLKTWLELDPDTVVSELPDTLLNDERLQRGFLLLRLGHFDEARAELEALREATSDNPLTQYRLALYFRDIGLYRSSIIAAATVRRLSPAGHVTEAPRFLGCLAYPTYYRDLVESEATTQGLGQLFIYALLRQESLFEGYATSYAAAQGLMQVIPSTGAYIADTLAWPPEYQTRDLYRPMVSIRFGVWYLAQQLDAADGNLFVAMAGYNGGPGNALRWWELAEEDPDLFAELIGFRETRTYVRVIYEQYDAYTWLYTERAADASGGSNPLTAESTEVSLP